MRGNTQIQRAWCPECAKQTRVQRNSVGWGGGDFLLILFTLGFWIPAKLLFVNWANPWRCSACGAKAR
jgi:hypothetical protein